MRQLTQEGVRVALLRVEEAATQQALGLPEEYSALQALEQMGINTEAIAVAIHWANQDDGVELDRVAETALALGIMIGWSAPHGSEPE